MHETRVSLFAIAFGAFQACHTLRESLQLRGWMQSACRQRHYPHPHSKVSKGRFHTMKWTGAQILMECLVREGVKVMFGFPGATVLEFYDQLNNYPQIQHILVRHEQGAVHAADGYARASGDVGVALTTSGPGATNTVTGIATAYCDSIPLVVFTGQVPTGLIGNDAFQEVDITGITRPCTKHNYIVQDVSQLAKVIRQAFFLARAGRPGPVLVDLPKNILQDTTEFVWPEVVNMRGYNPTYYPNRNQLRRAVDELKGSSRPLLFLGGGAVMSGASELARELAHKYQIPVTSSLMGLGAFPCDDPLWLGMLGMHGTYTANKAITNSDVLLAVGVRFDDRVTGRISAFAPRASIVHIDIDPTSIRKNVNVKVPVVADCRLALENLLEQIDTCAPEAQAEWPTRFREWNEQLCTWKKEQPISYQPTAPGKPIKPQEVIETLSRLTGGDLVLTTDVGQHQMWTAQFFTFLTPRTLLTSGGLGTMGYGLPAAIGAQLARPDKLVVGISGDGSFQMNVQELIIAAHNRLPIKFIVLNNHYLGLVRQLQHLFYDGRYSGVDIAAQPDFLKLAEAYGVEGYRIERIEDLKSTLSTALASPGTALVEVVVDEEEIVYPMVPSGAALDEMLLG